MRRFFAQWNLLKHFIFSGVLTFLTADYIFALFGQGACSVGIIGSADGPTAIYVSGTLTYFPYIAVWLIFFILYIPVKWLFQKLWGDKEMD